MEGLFVHIEDSSLEATSLWKSPVFKERRLLPEGLFVHIEDSSVEATSLWKNPVFKGRRLLPFEKVQSSEKEV